MFRLIGYIFNPTNPASIHINIRTFRSFFRQGFAEYINIKSKMFLQPVVQRRSTRQHDRRAGSNEGTPVDPDYVPSLGSLIVEASRRSSKTGIELLQELSHSHVQPKDLIPSDRSHARGLTGGKTYHSHDISKSKINAVRQQYNTSLPSSPRKEAYLGGHQMMQHPTGMTYTTHRPGKSRQLFQAPVGQGHRKPIPAERGKVKKQRLQKRFVTSMAPGARREGFLKDLEKTKQLLREQEIIHKHELHDKFMAAMVPACRQEAFLEDLKKTKKILLAMEQRDRLKQARKQELKGKVAHEIAIGARHEAYLNDLERTKKILHDLENKEKQAQAKKELKERVAKEIAAGAHALSYYDDLERTKLILMSIEKREKERNQLEEQALKEELKAKVAKELATGARHEAYLDDLERTKKVLRAMEKREKERQEKKQELKHKVVEEISIGARHEAYLDDLEKTKKVLQAMEKREKERQEKKQELKHKVVEEISIGARHEAYLDDLEKTKKVLQAMEKREKERQEKKQELKHKVVEEISVGARHESYLADLERTKKILRAMEKREMQTKTQKQVLREKVAKEITAGAKHQAFLSDLEKTKQILVSAENQGRSFVPGAPAVTKLLKGTVKFAAKKFWLNALARKMRHSNSPFTEFRTFKTETYDKVPSAPAIPSDGFRPMTFQEVVAQVAEKHRLKGILQHLKATNQSLQQHPLVLKQTEIDIPAERSDQLRNVRFSRTDDTPKIQEPVGKSRFRNFVVTKVIPQAPPLPSEGFIKRGHTAIPKAPDIPAEGLGMKRFRNIVQILAEKHRLNGILRHLKGTDVPVMEHPLVWRERSTPTAPKLPPEGIRKQNFQDIVRMMAEKHRLKAVIEHLKFKDVPLSQHPLVLNRQTEVPQAPPITREGLVKARFRRIVKKVIPRAPPIPKEGIRQKWQRIIPMAPLIPVGGIPKARFQNAIKAVMEKARIENIKKNMHTINVPFDRHPLVHQDKKDVPFAPEIPADGFVKMSFLEVVRMVAEKARLKAVVNHLRSTHDSLDKHPLVLRQNANIPRAPDIPEQGLGAQKFINVVRLMAEKHRLNFVANHLKAYDVPITKHRLVLKDESESVPLAPVIPEQGITKLTFRDVLRQVAEKHRLTSVIQHMKQCDVPLERHPLVLKDQETKPPPAPKIREELTKRQTFKDVLRLVAEKHRLKAVLDHLKSTDVSLKQHPLVLQDEHKSWDIDNQFLHDTCEQIDGIVTTNRGQKIPVDRKTRLQFHEVLEQAVGKAKWQQLKKSLKAQASKLQKDEAKQTSASNRWKFLSNQLRHHPLVMNDNRDEMENVYRSVANREENESDSMVTRQSVIHDAAASARWKMLAQNRKRVMDSIRNHPLVLKDEADEKVSMTPYKTKDSKHKQKKGHIKTLLKKAVGKSRGKPKDFLQVNDPEDHPSGLLLLLGSKTDSENKTQNACSAELRYEMYGSNISHCKEYEDMGVQASQNDKIIFTLEKGEIDLDNLTQATIGTNKDNEIESEQADTGSKDFTASEIVHDCLECGFKSQPVDISLKPDVTLDKTSGKDVMDEHAASKKQEEEYFSYSDSDEEDMTETPGPSEQKEIEPNDEESEQTDDTLMKKLKVFKVCSRSFV